MVNIFIFGAGVFLGLAVINSYILNGSPLVDLTLLLAGAICFVCLIIERKLEDGE